MSAAFDSNVSVSTEFMAPMLDVSLPGIVKASLAATYFLKLLVDL